MPACASLFVPPQAAVNGIAGLGHETSSTLQQSGRKSSRRACKVASRLPPETASSLLENVLFWLPYSGGHFGRSTVRRQQNQTCIAHGCAKPLKQRQEADLTRTAKVAALLSNLSSSERSAPEADSLATSRRQLVAGLSGLSLSSIISESAEAAPGKSSSPAEKESQSSERKSKVLELDGGLKALDVRIGTGAVPQEGDTIAIHYYGRLGAKQGWRFDSSYEHKDLFGVPEPYVFIVGSGQVIAGIDTAVRSMHVGGIRRVVIPPSQGYQNKEQGPIPPDFFDRQRLYTTIFNPTRLANGEGATLGTVIFDIELVRIQANAVS